MLTLHVDKKLPQSDNPKPNLAFSQAPTFPPQAPAWSTASGSFSLILLFYNSSSFFFFWAKTYSTVLYKTSLHN